MQEKESKKSSVFSFIKEKAKAGWEQLKDKDSKLCTRLIFVILGLSFLLGLLLVNDYGAPWDEREEITIFIGNVKEYARLFFGEDCSFCKLSEGIKYATDNVNIDHGESVYYVLIPFTRLYFSNYSLFVFLWRTVVHLVFLAGVWLLYLIVKHFTKDARLGLLAAIMLLLSPRFFAEGFYNHKDLAQMTLWLAMFYFTLRWIEERKYKFAVFLGVFAALSVNMRFAAAMGLAVCGITYIISLIVNRQDLKHGFLQGVVAVATFFVVLYAITPGAWNLIYYFKYCFKQAGSFPWGGSIYFGGEFYKGTALTNAYLPATIALTTPILFVMLFLLGVVVASFGIRTQAETGKRRLYCKLGYGKAMLLGMTFFPLLVYFVMKPVIYNGWRHYYFIYGFMIVWAALGMQWLLQKGKVVRRGAKACMITELAVLFAVICIGHPNQFAYYNVLGGLHPENLYETDYWGVSNVQALEALVQKEYSGEPLKIYGAEGNSTTILGRGLALYGESGKVIRVSNKEEADYLFVITMYCNEKRQSKAYAELSEYEKIVEVNYLFTELASVYKKN